MTIDAEGKAGSRGEVALFVTCLVDLMRPQAAYAALRLLQDAGYTVTIPADQSCCGQPGYNGGDHGGAAALARRTIAQLEGFSHVVLPSGSCSGMLRRHYPKLLDGSWRQRAQRLAGRVFELSEFLVEVAGYRPDAVSFTGPVAYHDGCAGLRELGVRDQPRQLLGAAGVELREPEQAEVCCGFGGTFCARMPDISAKMADDKLRHLQATGAQEVVAGDIGCLMALAGRARRANRPLRFRHFAEVLAGGPWDSGIGGDPQAPGES